MIYSKPRAIPFENECNFPRVSAPESKPESEFFLARIFFFIYYNAKRKIIQLK